MPHSTVADPVAPSSPTEEDSVLPDAPRYAPDEVKEEREEADENEQKDGDMIREAPKADVKLDDLFNDDDDEEDDDEEDDDEFSSSRTATAKVESSPPAAPL